MADEQQQIKSEHVRHALESRRQLRQATMNFEHAMLLNGGGLVALLTFLGTGKAGGLGWAVPYSLTAWGIGLVLAGLATWFGYQSQFKFYKAHGDYQRVQIHLMEYPVDDQQPVAVDGP